MRPPVGVFEADPLVALVPLLRVHVQDRAAAAAALVVLAREEHRIMTKPAYIRAEQKRRITADDGKIQIVRRETRVSRRLRFRARTCEAKESRPQGHRWSREWSRTVPLPLPPRPGPFHPGTTRAKSTSERGDLTRPGREAQKQSHEYSRIVRKRGEPQFVLLTLFGPSRCLARFGKL